MSPVSGDRVNVIGTTSPSAMLDAFGASFGVLSRLLRAPADAELLAALARPGQLGGWPMRRDEPTERGLWLLAEAVGAGRDGGSLPGAGSRGDSGEGLDELERDYARLFVGPGHLLAPPYESVHLTREHLLFDVPTRQVRAAYAEFGLVAPKLNREPDDHLGLELGFLAHLCSLGLDSLESGDAQGRGRALEALRRFLSEHVLRWAGQLFEIIEREADTRFYRGVGGLGLGVLRQAPDLLS